MSRHPAHGPTSAAALSAAVATAAALALVGCASDPSPGTFQGTGREVFEITLVVDEDLTVPEVRYVVTCDGTTVSEALALRPPLRTDRGTLQLEAGRLKLSGQFERNGTRAQGAWHFDDCSGTWRAENERAAENLRG